MPVGVPRKPNTGILNAVFSPAVIRYISRFRAVIASGDPPWYCCSENAHAWANPPRPTVSVMGLSPPIQVISEESWPGNSLPSTVGVGPRNHSSPSPLTRMANSWQEKPIAVTTLEPATPCAASAIALPAAMDRRRKK